MKPALAAVIAAVAAACGSARDIAPAPSPSSMSDHRTTPTAVPSATRTPRPTVDASVPVTVAMSLEAAREEVMSWLDPGQAPRIVSADYIPRAAVALHRFHDGTMALFDWYTGRLMEHTWADTDSAPQVFVRVVGETAALDAPLLSAWRIKNGRYAELPAPTQARFVAMFDAATGERVGAMAVSDDDSDPDIASILAAPTPALLVHITPVPPTPAPARQPPPTATAPRTPSPPGPAFDAATVPSAVRSAFDAYPLLPGSSWTWETVTWLGMVTWERRWMREIVTDAWRLGDDGAVVRLHVTRWGPELPGKGWYPAAADEFVWRAVRAVGTVRRFPDSPEYNEQWLSSMRQARADGIEPLGLPIETRVNVDRSENWGYAQTLYPGRKDVTTPAGTFTACAGFYASGGAGWGSVRAICPGIGYVETDTSSRYGMSDVLSVTRLIAYTVVRPR